MFDPDTFDCWAADTLGIDTSTLTPEEYDALWAEYCGSQIDAAEYRLANR